MYAGRGVVSATGIILEALLYSSREFEFQQEGLYCFLGKRGFLRDNRRFWATFHWQELWGVGEVGSFCSFYRG